MWAYDLKHIVLKFINHTPTHMYETVITIHLTWHKRTMTSSMCVNFNVLSHPALKTTTTLSYLQIPFKTVGTMYLCINSVLKYLQVAVAVGWYRVPLSLASNRPLCKSPMINWCEARNCHSRIKCSNKNLLQSPIVHHKSHMDLVVWSWQTDLMCYIFYCNLALTTCIITVDLFGWGYMEGKIC